MLNLFLYLLGAAFLIIALSGAAVVVTLTVDFIKDCIEGWRE